MNQVVSIASLAENLDRLADNYLNEMPARNTRVLFIQLKPQLERLRARGASYDQIHKVLLDKGVKVSIHTTRAYLADLFRDTPPSVSVPISAPVPGAAPERAPVSASIPVPEPLPAVETAPTPEMQTPSPETSTQPPSPETSPAIIRRAAPEIPPAPSRMPSGKGWRSSSAQIDGDLI